MDCLNFIGMFASFVLGIVLGGSFMYFANLMIEKWADSLSPEEIEEIIRKEAQE